MSITIKLDIGMSFFLLSYFEFSVGSSPMRKKQRVPVIDIMLIIFRITWKKRSFHLLIRITKNREFRRAAFSFRNHVKKNFISAPQKKMHILLIFSL